VTKASFYNTPEWRKLRFEILSRYGAKCFMCGAKPPSVTIHVDHIKPISKYPELKLEPSNLQLLCESCNLGKSNYSEEDLRTNGMKVEQTEEDMKSLFKNFNARIVTEHKGVVFIRNKRTIHVAYNQSIICKNMISLKRSRVLRKGECFDVKVCSICRHLANSDKFKKQNPQFNIDDAFFPE
jgi:hypothetical protein